MTGTPVLLLSDGGIASYASGTGTATSPLTFDYTVLSNQSTGAAALSVIGLELSSPGAIEGRGRQRRHALRRSGHTWGQG